MSHNDSVLFDKIAQALRDYNISITEMKDFKTTSHCEPAVWSYIDQPVAAPHGHKSTLEELLSESIIPPLPFAVRYQLEVCISHGYLNEHNLSREFIDRLMNMDSTKAQDILEYIANQEKRIWDPMELFDWKVIKGSTSRPPVPRYCAYMRTATVTPSTIYFNTPAVEITNRVVRHYSEHADRFLRVRFADEKIEVCISPR